MADAAYLAGIVDGEGSIILYKRKSAVAMLITVVNSNRAVLDWITQVTGVGAVCNQREEGARNKRTWFWRCNGDAAFSVLQQIRSYLVIKPVQADLAIDFQTKLRDPALKADRTWQHEYLARMRALNKRGPSEAAT